MTNADVPHPTRSPRLSLAHALAPSVSQGTRSKGHSYFTRGVVGDLASFGDGVSTTVKGSGLYEVSLVRDDAGYVGSCDCPSFIDREEICKHIWALVLAVDSRGLLPPESPETWLDPDPAVLDFGDDWDLPAPAAAPAPAPPPPAVDPWQRFLRSLLEHAVATETARPVSRYTDGEFIYVIDGPATLLGQGIVVLPMWRQRKKNGEWGKPQPAPVMATEMPQLADPIDREILSTLAGAADPSAGAPYGPMYGRALFRLNGLITDRAVRLLASSRRLYLRPQAYPPDELRPVSADTGDAWMFGLDVTTADDGAVRMTGSLTRGEDRMELPEPQMVLEAGYLIARGSLARLDHRGAFPWLAELRRSGPATFPAGALPELVEALARSHVDPGILPPLLRYEVVDAVPRPRLKIERGAAAGRPIGGSLSASLTFDYGGLVVDADPPFSAFDPSTSRLIRRDAAAEQAAVQRLHRLGFHRGWAYGGLAGELQIGPAQLGRVVRTLVEEGWHVEADGSTFRNARTFGVQVRSGIDWFELHGHIDFGEGRSASLTQALDALARGDSAIVLDDGTRGMVPDAWLRRYARIAGFGEVEGGHVRYKPSQTALLDALIESQPEVDVDEAFSRARAELQAFSGIQPVAAPASFTGALRAYQQDALGWFGFLRRFGFGGCLADDMGLGKTVMVLALLDARRLEAAGEHRPSLAVVPRSLVFNWIAEAKRFAPKLRVLDYTGTDRTGAELVEYDLVLTTYGTLRRDIARLTEREFDYVILDEAQAIKNAATVSARAVRLLRGRHRLALSGTPIENHIGELWSIFEFLNPGLLGSSAAFRRASSVQRRAGEDLALVSRALKPLILRRTKEQVAPELPSRTEQTIYCELDEQQRRFYDERRARYRASLLARVERDGLQRSKMHVLEALLRLRQAACHSGLVEPRRVSQPSAKFDVLVPRLLEVIDEGHKALVFSQFTGLLGLLRRRLEAEKVTYEYLDGQTRDRGARVERFSSDPGCPLFLISLKAGGLGLNLTAAEYVFLLDPWWNPAAEAQAIDRAHRIGQSRHVFAYRLIAKDTVEEKVAQLQASKRELADAILSADPALIRNLKVEDLEVLLS